MESRLIPHSRPWITQADLDAVDSVLKSGQLSQGPQVEAFEKEVASSLGRDEGVATSSGTAALHLALLALGVGDGDEVIIPSFVCTAVLNAVSYTGALPRIVDVDPSTYNIDPEYAAKTVTPKTKAMIVPHMFGCPADLDNLLKLGIPLIEDCAQAVGARYKDRPVGSFGVLSVCSFYATKVLTSGEGGMLLGEAGKLISKARDLRDYDNKPVYALRYNYKMTDVQAALGLSQFRRLDDMVQQRREMASRYFEEFGDCPVSLPAREENSGHIYFRFVVKAQKDVSEWLKELQARHIMCQRPVFRPLHAALGLPGCPQASDAWEKTLSIPLYPALLEEETETIVQNIRAVFMGDV